VSGRSKIEEVQFYLDRSQDALNMVVRSILDNPRIPDLERMMAFRMLAEHHGAIAVFIASRVTEGASQGYAKADSECGTDVQDRATPE
jgi:hypothetical protein